MLRLLVLRIGVDQMHLGVVLADGGNDAPGVAGAVVVDADEQTTDG